MKYVCPDSNIWVFPDQTSISQITHDTNFVAEGCEIAQEGDSVLTFGVCISLQSDL